MSEIRNITIYDRNGNVRATVSATDNCERVHSLMSDNYVQVSFNDENYRAFAAGDNIQYNGEKFWLLDDYFPENKGGYFNYSMRFSAIEEHFARPIFFREVEITNNATQVTEHWREPEFSLNANLLTIAKEVIKSLNANGAALFGAVFVLPDFEQGEYETELKALSFSGVSIGEAISYIAETFETEWWLEPQPNNTYILYFDKCEHGDFIELSDGYENVDGKWTCGVYDGDIMGGVKNVKISGSRENVVQRVFAYGSERNITRKVAQTGQAGGEMNVSYAKRLRLNPTLYPNGYIEVPNVTNGTEEVKFFDDIYPRRIGTISEVRRKVRTADEIFFVSDSELPTVEWDETAQRIFPKDFVIEGCTMMMRFVSGFLNGFEFEVNWKSETNEFEIINQEEDGQQIPMGAFVPRVGDQYVLWNMKMPQMYVDLAQQELAEKTQEYIAELQTSTPEVSFDSEPTSFAARGISLKVGSRVQLASVTAYRGNCIIQSRIVSYNYNLTTPEQISFKMASGRTTGRLAAIENAISQQVATIDGIRQTMRSVSPRAWRDAQEMSQMLDSLQKEMVLVGVEENTFTLTSGISIEHHETNGEIHEITLNITKGRLVHPTYGEWIIPQTELSLNNYGDEPLYVHAIGYFGQEIAVIELSSVRYEFYEEPDYNFLLGIVSSSFEGRRVFNQTSGFTQIAGGTITTQVVQDAARNLIIDFSSVPPRIIARNGAEIKGNIRFLESDDWKIATAYARNLVQINDGSHLELTSPTVNFGFRVLAELENDRTYTFQVGSSQMLTGNANSYSVRVFDLVANVEHCNFNLPINQTLQTCTFAVPSSGEWSLLVYAGIYGETMGKHLSLNKFMLQYGTIATLWQPSTENLVRAMAGSTEIMGGLTMTNVLMLKDENNAVVSGMSGLKEDNLLLWGGGTYDQANAAINDIHNTEFPVLLSKQGWGSKVGIFKVLQDRVVVDPPNSERKISITTKSIEEENSVEPAFIIDGVQHKILKAGKRYSIFASGGDVKITVLLGSKRTITGMSGRPQTVVEQGSVSYEFGTYLHIDNVRMAIDFQNYTFLSSDSPSLYNKLISNNGLGTTYAQEMEYTILCKGKSFIVPEESSDRDVFLSYEFKKVSEYELHSDTVEDMTRMNATVTESKTITAIGRDGLLLTLNSNEYFQLKEQDGHFDMKFRGTIDIPGVLASGTYKNGFRADTKFGKVTNAEQTATGKYRITHTIGSKGYVVMIMNTGHVAYRSIVVSKQNTYCDVEIYNGTSLVDDSFDFVIIGNN